VEQVFVSIIIRQIDVENVVLDIASMIAINIIVKIAGQDIAGTIEKKVNVKNVE
jgi:hypothetical protein